MPSSYTQNLGLEMPASGEQAGTWGNTVNSNSVSLDDAINGNKSIPLSASTYALITSQGTQSEGLYPLIVWTGALTQQTTVNIQPNTAQKRYTMINATTGGFTLVFQQGTGGSFTLQPGYGARIYTDGGGGTAKCQAELPNPQFTNVLVTGALQVQGPLSFTAPQTFTQPMTFNGAVSMPGGAAVNGLVLTNGAPAAYDIYYRAPSTGLLTPLPVGSPGQQLIVLPGGNVGWGLSQAAVGSVVSGSTPNELFFSNASNQLAQSSLFAAVAGVGIGLGVAPGHSLQVGYGLPPEIWLDTNTPAIAAQQRQLVFATNAAPRWLLYSPVAAEPGSNVGSNIVLASYNDAQNVVTTTFSAFRATGDLTVGALGDYNAQLAVINQAKANSAVIVRGASGQTGNLQSWQNSAGTTVASIDASGNATFANSGSGLALDGNGRLNLHGTVAGAPWGTIHIGPEGGPVGQTRGSIAFESASQAGSTHLPPGVVDVYVTPNNFVIQAYYNGIQYYFYLPLTTGQSGGAVSWNVTTTPISF
jgi:hypothetical protein